jgi:protein gp37
MTEMLGDYKVHPAASIFPLLSEPELNALAEDIDYNGLIDPIVLSHDNTTIIDGRNRWLACARTKTHVDPVFRPLGAHYTEEMILRFIIARNMKRRDLDPGQRAAIGLKFRPRLAEAAKQRQLAGLKKGDQLPVRPISAKREVRVDDQVAVIADVAGSTVRQAEAVERDAPDLLPKVIAGSITLNDAYKQTKDRKQADERPAKKTRTTITLQTHEGRDVEYPKPSGKPTFNSTNEQISWAKWSWNPVTGCLHGCKYCYARELALRPSYAATYPVGFTPLFHSERLSAPRNTEVPEEAEQDPRFARVFVCSMADLYGKWVPDEWIEQVHQSCIDNPQWDYLMLTKFPRRYVGLDLPKTAWLGTSVDEQKRVRLAEDAFRQIQNVRVKWLSLEPLLAPLQFTDLSMFDWVVIGAQSATEQPEGHVEAFSPPMEWVTRLIDQAHEAGCAVYLKENLQGKCTAQSPGMKLIQEEPRTGSLRVRPRQGRLALV